MGILRNFLGRLLFPWKRSSPFVSSKESLRSIATHLPTLGKDEIILRIGPSGVYDVFSSRELTKDQLDLLCRGEIPEGIIATKVTYT